MSLLRLASRLPAYWLSRALGRPPRLPFSLVISVCYRCNSRCSTCNVWKKDARELTLDEWTAVFEKLGHSPYYMTFSGGEPFLRDDLVEIVAAAYRLCRPAVITIPTNGLLTTRIPERVEAIVRAAPGAQIGINLSLDGIGEQHDQIRNVPGNWNKALETYRALKALDYPNLTVSIHTVISTLNVADLPAIYEGLIALEPDSYITEIAEERGELDTIGANITPSLAEYAVAADFLIERLHAHTFQGFARITQAFRAQYYALATRILAEKRQVIPCYAGWASGHIAPDGDVWTCCVRAEPIGNLREHEYDLSRVWTGERADKLRRSIRAGECACPMANASYANMLLHPPTVARVMGELVLGRRTH
jgi:MoaA/NifB/PqqE/SkfB family radical SAM enzyme